MRSRIACLSLAVLALSVAGSQAPPTPNESRSPSTPDVLVPRAQMAPTFQAYSLAAPVSLSLAVELDAVAVSHVTRAVRDPAPQYLATSDLLRTRETWRTLLTKRHPDYGA